MTASPLRPSRRARRWVSGGLGVVLLGGGLVLVGATPAQAVPVGPAGCALSSSTVHTFAADASSTYLVPDGIHAIVTAVAGGSGSLNSDYTTPIAPGALVSTVLAVTPGDSLSVDVGTSASGPTGGTSGGATSGGAGSTHSAGGDDTSGAGGGATFISRAGDLLVAAGGGGGGAYAGVGGPAGPVSSTHEAAGTVFGGTDGSKADPTAGGGGGAGGTTTPGAGGVAAPGYGAGNGHPGVGRVGGAAFDNGGGNVGAGGGGGGYAGGGGGGGGGYAGGGGAGSSFSATAYSVAANAGTGSVTLTAAPPTFGTADSTTFVAGQHSSFTVCAPAAPTATLTSTGALPSGVTVVDNGDGTATISGTPSGGSVGAYPLDLAATNANGDAAQTFHLNVVAAAVSKFRVVVPTTATAGTAINATVTALDRFGNVTTGYTSHVHLTSSDPDATLPANATLADGTGAFAVTLNTAGAQTITATDTTHHNITGTSGHVTVAPGAVAAVAVQTGNTQAAVIGTAFTRGLSVTVVDAHGNGIAGADVTFDVLSGPGSFAGSATVTATTDAAGVATSPVVTAGSTPGTIDISAQVDGAAAASFTLTVQADPLAGTGADVNGGLGWASVLLLVGVLALALGRRRRTCE